MTRPIPRRTAAAALFAALATPAPAQEAGGQALRIIIPQPPGGATDVLARLLSEPLSRELGRPVVVENRPGANGIVSTNALKQSPPDGGALLLGGVSIFSFNPNLYPSLPYDPWRDFAWIAPVADTPFVVVAGRRTGIASTAQLLERARTRPEGVTYGSAGIGNSTHLAMEMIAERAGVRLTHVPFPGSAPASASLAAGDTDCMVNPLGNTLSLIAGGDAVPLATLGAERAPALPEVPTLRETGLEDVGMPGWYAFVGPTGVPAPVVERLNAAVRAVVDSPAVAQRLREAVLEPLSGSAASLLQRARSDSEAMAAFIRRRGIKVE
jgi:tripartite-type tricarboxylate transporter receptor subunit TctC